MCARSLVRVACPITSILCVRSPVSLASSHENVLRSSPSSIQHRFFQVICKFVQNFSGAFLPSGIIPHSIVIQDGCEHGAKPGWRLLQPLPPPPPTKPHPQTLTPRPQTDRQNARIPIGKAYFLELRMPWESLLLNLPKYKVCPHTAPPRKACFRTSML